jgi:2-keto-3-deoxy-L-rhamnonate aldolase RhmA
VWNAMTRRPTGLATKADPVVGTRVQMNSPETCELATAVGFDLVIIDLEHGSFDLADAVNMIRAVEAKGGVAVGPSAGQ